MKKLRVKIKAIITILTSKHWFIVKQDTYNLTLLLKDKDFDIDLLYYGLQPYGVWKIIKSMSYMKDDNDMILDKAKFEAEAELYKNKK